MTTPVVLESRPSTIRLPVGVPLKELEKLINAETPVRLYTIDEPQQTCIKTKSPLLPDVSCRLVGKVDRGPIRLTGSGKTLILTMPVRTTVHAQNIGKIIKQETADGAVDVQARLTLDIAPNWTPQAKMQADYRWTDKLGIDFLGQRITFAEKVDPKLRELLQNLERSLPRQLNKLQARQHVAHLWAKGFTSVRAQTQPPIWVRFTPQRVGFSGYQARDGMLVLDLSAQARTETLFGAKPADPTPTPLPQLTRALPADGIHVYVPTLVKYEVLEAAARKALVSQTFRPLIANAPGAADAIVHDVTLYGTAANRIAVGLDVSLKTFGGMLATKGRIWFIAEPVVDVAAKVVRLRDLAVAGQTDSKTFNALLTAVNGTTLRDRVIQTIRYDFAQDYAAGLEKADTWLEAEPFEGFVFKGDLGDAAIRAVRIAPDGLIVEAEATGAGSLTWAPREATQLVIQRKAKRAAREAAKAADAAKVTNMSAEKP